MKETILTELQIHKSSNITKTVEDEFLNWCFSLEEEEIDKKQLNYEDRKCFCITTTGELACRRLKSGGLYKVDIDYTMTDDPIEVGTFDRWATSFDI